ncbi:6-pyruvoyl trahydropterin synthase family protein [Nibricoccus sp. IMCC34717]|uniref:6-pyruvoyl trahydropterin synthase family protein n=1 Tax=Nibricoccus sp. IMCC34717 TaxID=3034021 RepID=UPI00384F654C
MPYRVCKSFEVENGHMLSKHPDKCRFPHGHSRVVEVVLVAEALDANDMVCDFKAIKAAIEAFVDRFDHALCVNTRDPQFASLAATYGGQIIPFEGVDPTTEVMAKTIFDEMRRQLATPLAGSYQIPAGVRLERVRVGETSTSWAEYFE